MSVVHDSLQRDRNVRQSWFLKIADGSSYGPVGMSTLCEWSAQSRIVPGNKISNDGRRWVPAETVRELKMEWVAELPNGDKYGPFNVLAVPHLFQSGTLPPEAKLTSRVSGKTVLVYELVKSTLAKEPQPVEAGVEPTPQIPTPARSANIGPKEVQIEFLILEPPDIKAEPVSLRDDRSVIQDLESQVKYLSIQLEHTRREWARNKESIAGDSGAREQELANQIERLRKDRQTDESEIENARSEATAERQTAQELREQLRRKEDELTAKAAQLTAQIESRSVELERAKENADKKSGQLSLRVNELENMLKESSDKTRIFEKELAGQKEHYEYVINQEQEQQETLKRRIVETERELDSKTNLLSLAMRAAEDKTQRLSDTSKSDKQNKELRLQVDALESRLDRAQRQLLEKDERHAKAAQQHTTACDELKLQIADLQSKAKSANSDLANARRELENREREVARQAEELRNQADEASDAAGQLKIQMSAGEDNYNRLKTEHEAVVQHLEATTSQLQRVLGDQELAQKQHAEFQVTMQGAATNAQNLIEAQREAERLRKDLNDKEQEAAKKERESQDRADSAIQGLESTRKELSALKEQYRNLEEKNRISSKTIEIAKADLQRANEKIALAVKQPLELQAASKSASEAERKLTESQKQLEMLTKQLHTAEQEAQKHLQKVQARAENAARETEGLQHNLKTQASTAAQEVEKLRREIAARDDKCRALELQNKATGQELATSKTELQRIRDVHERSLKQRNEAESAARQAAAIAEQKLGEAIKQSEALGRELRGRDEKLAKDTPQLTTRLDKMTREMEKLRQEVASKDEKLHAQKEDSAELVKEVENARLELKHLSQQSEALVAQHQNEQAANAKRMSDLEAEKARYMQAAEKTGVLVLTPAKTKPFRPLMKTAAVIVALVGCSATAFYFGTRYNELAPSPIEEDVEVPPLIKSEPAKPNPKPIKLNITPLPVIQETLVRLPAKKEAPPLTQPQKIVWPEIKVDKVTVVHGDKSCSIIFEFGVFRSLTKFSDDAVPTLEQVAAQLRGSISDFDLLIEGHADMVRVSAQATSSFADNDKLGMERAKAVRDLFKDKFNIPSDRMNVVSSGEKDPPFSNDDETSRKKNRTVVLKLTPKTSQR